MGNRVNPRRVPRTQKDVDAAYDRGAETVLPDTIHSIENWLKEEMDE